MRRVPQRPDTQAAIYIRVSSSQQEQDGTSLESQERLCRLRAAERGLSVDEAHVYSEVYSGAILHDRPKLTMLRQEARNGSFATVICYAVDRLSRNQAHLYIVAEELESAGVRLEFVTEDFEDSAVGKFIRSAKAFAAEVEREKFRERSMRGKMARVQAGKLMHGKTPLYGYDWTDDSKGRLAINPIHSGIVQRIFAESLEGKPLRSIAAGLSRDGIPTPRQAQLWDFVVVGKILHNPAYMGEAYAFRVRYERIPGTSRSKRINLPPEEWVRLPEGTIPAIVSRDMFEAVQARLALNKIRSPRRTLDREAYLLRGGFVRCGYCGYSMVVHQKQRTNTYECVKRSRASGLCTQHGISTRILDQAVWARVEKFLTQPDIIAGELERLQSDDPTQADLDSIERGIVDAERKIKNLTRSLALFEEAEAAAPLVAEIQALRNQQRLLENERTAVLARRAGWEAGQRRLADLQHWCQQVSTRLGELSYEQKRLALEALGVEIRVWKADHEPRYVITAHLDLDIISGDVLEDPEKTDPPIALGYMLRPRTPAHSGNW